MRLVVGNLAAEIEMARAATPGPHPDLSPAAARAVARHAEHLRVFARPGDRLCVPGVGSWELGVGEGTEILAWAETDAVEGSRGRGVEGSRDSNGTWQERLWHLHPDAATARACNHRCFGFALAEREGWSLPGARLITSLDELPRGSGTWIAKAPFSAAGRERVRFASRDEQRARLDRLLVRFGQLLVEPWVDRVLDLGCAGLVGDAVEVFSPHRLESDASGVFRAATIDDSGDAIAESAVLSAVRDTASAAGDALGAAGYRGPFSIDAYLWRDSDGRTHLQRLSEINARLTFGLVARAAAEDAGGGRFELRL